MTSPVDAPARPPRPVTVLIAFWLQVAVVLVLLGLVALVVAQAIGLPALPLAAWMAAMALPLRRDGNTARILVFVAGGVQLLICLAQGCAGALAIPLIFAADLGEPPFPEDDTFPEECGVPVPSDDPSQESPFVAALYDSPDPFDQIFVPLGGIGILAVLTLSAAVVLLLALPPAHRWFVPWAAAPIPPLTSLAPAPFGSAPSYGYYPPTARPAYVPVPPGFLICPDPAAHLTPPASGPAPGPTDQPQPPEPVTSGS